MDATIKQKLLNIDRETDSADGRMRFLMTSDALDRDGEVVDPDGMLADSFMRNPVFLYGHDSYAPPMGRIVSLSRTGAGWEAEVEWADAINPFAAMIKAYYDAGFMRAVSIRFIPKEWETGNPDEDGYTYKFTKWELLELSAVTIPSNPEALRVRSACEGPVRQWIKGLQAAMDTPENKPETKAESAEAPANTPAPCDGETNAGVSFSTTGMWMSSTADMAHTIKWYDNAGNEIPLPECVTWIGTGDTPPWTEEKIGAELSKRNRGRLAGIKSALKSCYDDLDALLAKWNEAEGCDEDDDDDDEKGLDTGMTDATPAKSVQAETAQGTPAAEVGEERKTDDGGITLDSLVGDEVPEGFHVTEQDIAETVGRKLTEIMAEWEAAKSADEDYLSGRAAIRHLLE